MSNVDASVVLPRISWLHDRAFAAQLVRRGVRRRVRATLKSLSRRTCNIVVLQPIAERMCAMDSLHIEPLGLHPDLVETTVSWHLDEFDPGGDAAPWINARKAEVQLGGIPCAWVAFLGQDAVGTVSLIELNMDTRPDLTPWLAALFVLPDHRRRGIGTALTRRCEQEARTLGLSRLYLYTTLAENFYARLGWSTIWRETYEDELVTVMQRQLGA
jgi:GNAT superfamily N-acetyltransferase